MRNKDRARKNLEPRHKLVVASPIRATNTHENYTEE
jgi:hypothetical protein